MQRYNIIAIFRKHKDGTIDALFPYEAEYNYQVLGYTHVGQHFTADYDHVLQTTVPATPLEYYDLLYELTNHVGYNVKVIKKANRNKMMKSWHELYKPSSKSYNSTSEAL